MARGTACCGINGSLAAATALSSTFHYKVISAGFRDKKPRRTSSSKPRQKSGRGKTELHRDEHAKRRLATEANPFTAQAQGMIRGSLRLACRIPAGNGRPIRNPEGEWRRAPRKPGSERSSQECGKERWVTREGHDDDAREDQK